jgi:hypothetical protein
MVTGVMRFWGMMRRHRLAVLALVLIPLLASTPIISGVYSCDPAGFYSGLMVGESPIPTGNVCFIDPSVAFWTQAMGYLSAQDWLHGVIPWWDPYTGVGLPLAAEMQNESLFLPFVLLLHFHNGWLIQRLMFQILCGLLTYAFLTGLEVGVAGALLGGALFSLNGTFTLSPGPVICPIFFLPMLLIGVERAAAAARDGRGMGWSVIALAIAGSIYAGFPEVAYFDGLLAACWAGMRFYQSTARKRFALKCAAGGVVGVALTAPQAMPFLQYLRLGVAGLHGGWLAHSTLPAAAAPLQLLPLFYGAISHFTPASLAGPFALMWVRVGGWFGCAPVLLALAAVCRRRPERYLLAGWVVLWELRFFGLPGITPLLNLVPGIAASDALRYAAVPVEFAVFALAACGFDDLWRRVLLPKRALRWAVLVFAVCLVGSVAPALRYLPRWFGVAPELRWPAVFYAVGVAGMLAVLVYALATGRGRRLAGGFVIGGAVGLYLLPQLGGYRTGHIDRGVAVYLQDHAGLSRYFSIGPFAANFPADDGVAGLNALQVPDPANWHRFFETQLVGPQDNPFYGATIARELPVFLAHLPAFAGAGAKYIGIVPGQDGLAGKPGLRLVYQNDTVNLYELAAAAPYAQTGADCGLVVVNRQEMRSDCKAPSVLLRRELFYPGWHAVVNKVEVPVAPDGDIFQRVNLPAGPAEIRFWYMPEGTARNCAVAILAALVWGFCGWRGVRARR